MILGVGELLWDIFPTGERVAGGAPFNFAYHCHALGHAAAVVSRVGNDDLGRELRAEVRRLGMTDEFIQTDDARPTGTVTAATDAAGVAGYTIGTPAAWDAVAPTAALLAAAATADVVCFGTLAMRDGVSRGTIEAVVNAVRGRGLVVFDVNVRQAVTPAFRERVYRAAAGADWVKVNEDETGVVPAGGAFVRIETRGPRGTVMADRAGVVEIPGVPATVVDTVGAGDAFTAAMVCKTREGWTLAEAGRFAAYYAARTCEHRGAIPPR